MRSNTCKPFFKNATNPRVTSNTPSKKKEAHMSKKNKT